MNMDLALVLLLLAAAIVMFVINRPRMDAVALLMIVLLPFTGVLTINEAMAGFADPVVILIAALFVIGEGLVRTGVARRLGDWLNATAGGSETRLLVLLMLSVAGLGAFMSGTAVVAIFIPVVLRICQNTGIAPSRLMMPLSMAALLSGTLTLVATAPNLVINAELTRQGIEGFSFFAFTPFGVVFLALGILYLLLARGLLPSGAATPAGRAAPNMRQWVAEYGLTGRAHRARVRVGSPLAGLRLEEIGRRVEGVELLAIEVPGRFATEVIRPTPRTVLAPGQVLLLDVVAPGLDIARLAAEEGLDLLPLDDGGYFTDRSQEIGMVEALVPPESALVGQTVLQARVRGEMGLTVLGLRRGQRVLAEDFLRTRLKPGDTLLLTGFWSDIRKLDQHLSDLVVLRLPAEEREVLPAASRAPQALAVLALTVGLMISGLVSNAHAALIGCLLMGLLRCVDFNSAYASISWKSLVLIVGMLPFSLALQRTGGVELAADAVTAMAGGAAAWIILGLLFVITAMLGLFISNTATAVLMAPVGIAVAQELGVSPYPFAMTIAIAASAAFMTPVSSPTNTLVVGPGNYSFGDFVKIGVPFTLIVMAATLVLVPWLLPL
ncbi:SLC13 family permease [Roseococcus sp. SDR]|uniref:SLC13 family permease n=1 Tax=Roseococcus sp. SDR TaxID=2835532 RepID=UPI001BCF0D26|nr:SLC13 family permease [Roseococcus sp. SDR]MBS7793086.1 SLC13 family permease [Roseococcus sp. SDR]MBV1848400.1 SLC13 family permease [Roseococcus sp. SDR]